MPKLETALVFENPADGTSLQFEMDADGYSLTVFTGDDADEGETMNMDLPSLVRLTNFLTDIINEGAH